MLPTRAAGAVPAFWAAANGSIAVLSLLLESVPQQATSDGGGRNENAVVLCNGDSGLGGASMLRWCKQCMLVFELVPGAKTKCPGDHARTNYSKTIPAGVAAGNARITNVGTSQSCMVSKLPAGVAAVKPEPEPRRRTPLRVEDDNKQSLLHVASRAGHTAGNARI